MEKRWRKNYSKKINMGGGELVVDVTEVHNCWPRRSIATIAMATIVTPTEMKTEERRLSVLKTNVSHPDRLEQV